MLVPAVSSELRIHRAPTRDTEPVFADMREQQSSEPIGAGSDRAGEALVVLIKLTILRAVSNKDAIGMLVMAGNIYMTGETGCSVIL